MPFYRLHFGCTEYHVDRRDPRPPLLASESPGARAEKPRRRAKRAR